MLGETQLEALFSHALLLNTGFALGRRAQILEPIRRLKADDGAIEIIRNAPATPDQFTQTQRHLVLLSLSGNDVSPFVL
jgi:hypothetical protein